MIVSVAVRSNHLEIRRSLLAELAEVSWWRYGLGIILLGFAVIAVLVELQAPEALWTVVDTEGERHTKTWALWLAKGGSVAAGIGALAGLVSGGLRSVRDATILERYELVDRTQMFCNSLFTMLASRDGSPPWTDLAVRFYCVEGNSDQSSLVLVAETRHHNRTSGDIKLKLGKGVAGVAWDRQAYVVVNRDSSDFRQALDSRDLWENAPTEITMKLTFDEANRLYADFGASSAYPIRTDSGTVGVIAVDCPKGFFRFLKREALGDLEMLAEMAAPDIERLFEGFAV